MYFIDSMTAAIFYIVCFILAAIFAVFIYPVILFDKIIIRKNLSRTPKFEKDCA